MLRSRLSAKLLKDLEGIVGEEDVSVEVPDLLVYSRDASDSVGHPDVVVWPEGVNEVSDIMKFGNKHEIPITPRGAGTSLSGGPVPQRGGIVLVLNKMDSILSIDEADLQVLVECGVVWKDLNDSLAERGLFLPPDPASGDVCTIGGCIAECAGGVRAVKYGTFREWVLGLEVVLPNGKVTRTGVMTRKTASGYDLTRLFVGSEGTLGVVTKARLKIHPIPPHRLLMSAFFKDVGEAGRAVYRIIRVGLSPSAAELMDKLTVKAVSEHTKMDLPRDAAMLIFEFDGSSLEELKERMRIAEGICRESGAEEISITEREEESERLWQARKSALPAMANLNPTMKPSVLLEDITVPISRIPEMLVAIEKTSEKYDVLIPTFAHAGDGNMHPTIIYDERDPIDSKNARLAGEEIFRLGLKMGGTISGEHGIGSSKKKYFAMEHDETEIDLMRKIKNAFDPKGIMNPGKIWWEA